MAEKGIRIVSPAGIAAYPKLSKPDFKYNKDGEFNIKVRFPAGPETDAFIAKLQAAYDDNVAKRKAEKGVKVIKEAPKNWVAEIDKETGTPTGFTVINFKQTAKITSKAGEVFNKTVDVFDRSKNPIDKASVGSGSTVKVATEVYPFFNGGLGAGLSLRLLAVQVLELVKYGERDAASYGFGDESEEDLGGEAPTETREAANAAAGLPAGF